MNLLYLIADGASVRGLIIYGVGMTFIVGVLAWATHADHRRE
jgi:hypothetical protein